MEDPNLQKYMVAFSKGSRQCLGMNLAYAEMYIALAAIFRHFGSSGPEGVRFEDDEGELDLFETGPDDIHIVRAAFLPCPAKTSRGIRFLVRN